MLPTLALFSSLVASAVVCATDIDAPRRADIEAMLNDFERNNAVWYSLERNDYAAALELASPLAERGSAIAMYVMGELRMVGTELDGDPAVAVAWFEQAAASWSLPALARLSGIYWTGYAGAKDPVRARQARIRWANGNAEVSRHYADKTKPVLFVHRPGEGPQHRYWTERASYFEAYARLVGRATENTYPVTDPQQVPIGKLPDTCHPAKPPAAAMAVAKVDRVDGTLTLLTSDSNEILGMVVDGISSQPLRVAALDVFQEALRSSRCVTRWPTPVRPVQIPFTFQVY